ncbi:hypothetical protein Ddc_03810 [Ditylenchus destructor]|nr:hypothetical protein Ddc_03810 [Ditylenchus destructor]
MMLEAQMSKCCEEIYEYSGNGGAGSLAVGRMAAALAEISLFLGPPTPQQPFHFTSCCLYSSFARGGIAYDATKLGAGRRRDHKIDSQCGLGLLWLAPGCDSFENK